MGNSFTDFRFQSEKIVQDLYCCRSRFDNRSIEVKIAMRVSSVFSDRIIIDEIMVNAPEVTYEMSGKGNNIKIIGTEKEGKSASEVFEEILNVMNKNIGSAVSGLPKDVESNGKKAIDKLKRLFEN